jgi:fructuronate reductase
MRCATGHDGQGRRLSMPDPMAQRLRRRGQSAGEDPQRLVDAFLGLPEIFGHDLPRDASFRAALAGSLQALQTQGARKAAAACAAGALP